MRTLLLCLCLCLPVIAQTPKKGIPLVIDGNTIVIVKSLPVLIKAPPGKGLFLWTYPDTIKADTDPENENILIIKTAPKGTYVVKVLNVKYDKTKDDFVKEKGETTVIIGEGSVPPDPPDPIDPAKGPLRVLIVYDSAGVPKMDDTQRQILFDAKVRGALKDRTDKAGPDSRGWNIWPATVDVSAADKFWQDAMKRPKPTLPYIHLYKSDKIVFEGPLPKTVEETINLITKYSGS